MKHSPTLTKLVDNSVAADAVCQGTQGAGGESAEVTTDRPCTIYGTGKACPCITKKCRGN